MYKLWIENLVGESFGTTLKQSIEANVEFWHLWIVSTQNTIGQHSTF